DLHHHHVTDTANIADARDVFARKLADVAEAILAGQNLDKSAEVFHARDGSLVDPSDLDRRGHRFDATQSPLDRRLVGTGDRDRAVFLDIDGDAFVLLDSSNRLSARANEQADLLRI